MADYMNISILDSTGVHRKFIKIVPYNTGGFAFILPRLVDSQKGRLEKTQVKYKKCGTHLDIKRDESEQYCSKDIVKFSYHPDGFVQFSSATNIRIISGRKPDGTPKGLGLTSWPLENPISTGPSMTITFWGIDKLAIELPSKIDNRFVFDVKESVKHPKANFDNAYKAAYVMAIYLIPNSINGSILDKDGKKTAHLAMMQALPGGRSFMRLRELVRIIEIPKQNYRIAISWFLVPKETNSESGYIFFGPTDGKRGLVASYPAVDHDEKLKMINLSFIADKSKCQ